MGAELLIHRHEELRDPKRWLARVASEQTSARRLSQFYSGLDLTQPGWRSVLASPDFQRWAVERNDQSGTRIVDMLYELRDDYNFNHFVALLRHYISTRLRGQKSGRPVVSGRYELLRKLGAGGFGEVYLAWSWETNTLYALKMIRPELLEDKDALARFKKEAECWVRCAGHPNIVRAYFLDHMDGQFYITLEYIAGREGEPSLLQQIGASPTDEQLLLWFGDVVGGLSFAYQSGLRAHRDLKPGNILVDENGLAKVCDFGLAGLSEEIVRGFPENERNFLLTQRGTVFGSLPYMAPEQFRNPKGCDERSDIYSLGMTFYQLASNGDLPMGDMSTQTHMWNRVRRFHEVEQPKAITSRLWPVIQKCIAKNPADRYQTVGAVRADLETVARKLGIQLREQKAQELDYWAIGDRAVMREEWNHNRRQQSRNVQVKRILHEPQLEREHVDPIFRKPEADQNQGVEPRPNQRVWLSIFLFIVQFIQRFILSVCLQPFVVHMASRCSDRVMAGLPSLAYCFDLLLRNCD
jgi:eukaryotic-like serine/threonine-protein kinase